MAYSSASNKRHLHVENLVPDFTIALIVAAAENGVIGRGGRLPWRMPSDLKTFRRLTMGKPVVMGRKTYQSIGKPLDGRDNIVVSRDPDFAPQGVIICRTLVAGIEAATACATRRGTDEIMIIGGAEIYRQAMPFAGRIYLSRIAAQPEGDATFPEPDPAEWRLSRFESIPVDTRDEHAVVLEIYERTGPSPA